MPDDFEDLLDDDSDLGDKDLLVDLLEEETEGTASKFSVDELQNKVKELEAANAGLLQAKRAETKKRQEYSDRMNQLEGAVGAILSQRQQQGIESITERQAADARKLGIPVNYDDDGNGWIDPNSIQSLVTPYMQKINELEAALQRTSAQSNAITEAERIRQSIIGEDERFGPASGRYRAARKWVEDRVSEYARANNIRRPIQSGEALDDVFDRATRKEFEQEFGKINLFNIVTAEDSKEHFRMALDGIARAMEPELATQTHKEKMDSRFQKVLNKPSALGSQANAKAGQLSILDRVGSMKSEDIMSLSDEQIDALMSLAAKDGI